MVTIDINWVSDERPAGGTIAMGSGGGSGGAKDGGTAEKL